MSLPTPLSRLKERSYKVKKGGEKKVSLLRRMDIQMRRSLKVNLRCSYDI